MSARPVSLCAAGRVSLQDLTIPESMMRPAAREEGQTSVEYALVLLLTALVLVYTLTPGINSALQGVVAQIITSLP